MYLRESSDVADTLAQKEVSYELVTSKIEKLNSGRTMLLLLLATLVIPFIGSYGYLTLIRNENFLEYIFQIFPIAVCLASFGSVILLIRNEYLVKKQKVAMQDLLKIKVHTEMPNAHIEDYICRVLPEPYIKFRLGLIWFCYDFDTQLFSWLNQQPQLKIDGFTMEDTSLRVVVIDALLYSNDIAY